MIKFCKLCLIIAFYMIFWTPKTTSLLWNISPLLHNDVITLLKTFSFFPYIITFFFGIVFAKDEFIFFFSGGLFASIIQLFLSIFVSLSKYQIYPYDPFRYLTFAILVIIQLFQVTFFYGLGMLTNKYLINKFFQPSDNILLDTPEVESI